MTNDTSLTKILLHITVRQSVTALPRCLQIFSRRGYIIEHLTTERIDEDHVVLHIKLIGHDRWHESISQLLLRIVGVSDVQKEALHD